MLDSAYMTVSTGALDWLYQNERDLPQHKFVVDSPLEHCVFVAYSVSREILCIRYAMHRCEKDLLLGWKTGGIYA